MGTAKIFFNKNSKQIDALLKSIYYDYIILNKSTKEMAEDYPYSERQLRYIIDRYLLVKKGKGNKMGRNNNENEEDNDIKVERVDDDIILINGKAARKTTVQDLIEKCEDLIGVIPVGK